MLLVELLELICDAACETQCTAMGGGAVVDACRSHVYSSSIRGIGGGGSIVDHSWHETSSASRQQKHARLRCSTSRSSTIPTQTRVTPLTHDPPFAVPNRWLSLPCSPSISHRAIYIHASFNQSTAKMSHISSPKGIYEQRHLIQPLCSSPAIHTRHLKYVIALQVCNGISPGITLKWYRDRYYAKPA